jgi:hypothetical protein
VMASGTPSSGTWNKLNATYHVDQENPQNMML